MIGSQAGVAESMAGLAGLTHDTFPRRQKRQEVSMPGGRPMRPAASKAQRAVAAIALHHPGQLYDRNKSMASMPKAELHKMASTPSKGLPRKKKPLKHIGQNAMR